MSFFDEAYTIGMRPIFQKMSYDKPVHSFLSNFVFGGDPIISREERILSQFRLRGAKVLDDDRRGDTATQFDGTVGHKNRFYTPLYYFKQKDLTRDDFKNCCFGEDPSQPWTRDKRIMSKAAEAALNISESLQMTREKRCADVLFTGKIVPVGNAQGDIEFLKAGTDFPVSKNIYNDPTSKWNAQGANIYNNLVAITTKEFQKRGIYPDTLICGPAEMDYIINDTAIKAMLDNRRIEMGYVRPTPITAEGACEIGVVKLANGCYLRLVTYVGFSIDKSGNQASVIPANKILLTRQNIGCFGYGVLEDMKGGMPTQTPGKELVSITSNREIPVTYSVQYQQACLPMPRELDGWAAVTVIW